VKLRIYEGSSNYTATVITLPVKQKVEGLDNLVKVEVFGNDCLISKDSNEEDLYLFFPAECQLSQKFLSENNLYRHSNFNKDSTKAGFFEDTGRVKAIKFRGIISTGFVIPATSLMDLVGWGDAHYVYSTLKVGDEFNEIGDVEVCRKFTRKENTPRTKEEGYLKRVKKMDKMIPNQFRFHSDTSPLARNIYKLDPNDIITISDKLHGTSAIFSNVLINKKLKWYEKALKRYFKIPIESVEYDNIYSSRRVIKNEGYNVHESKGYYGEDIWGQYMQILKDKIEEGITLYGEIVGWLQSGKYIQSKYDYGCLPGESEFYIYRITYTKPNGQVIEFNQTQMEEYCNKYQIKQVPILYYGKAKDLFSSIDTRLHWHEQFLKALSDVYLEIDCKMCRNKVPREGICLRVEKGRFETFKYKSKLFTLHETKALDKGEENIEDNQ